MLFHHAERIDKENYFKLIFNREEGDIDKETIRYALERAYKLREDEIELLNKQTTVYLTVSSILAVGLGISL